MITLEKLAGQNEEMQLLDKVAEAMDYLEANGIDPIGGLTALMNIDADGNVLDEKVASELDKLAEEQIDALSKVAEYLAGEEPSEIAKIALEINENAQKIEKVAEAMDYLEANGIDPESAFIIAANVTEDGTFADEKVASEVAEAGFEDADFDKIAEAIEYLGENGISLEDAIATAEFLKEAAPSEELVRAGDKAISALGTALKRRVKGMVNSYKAALTGKGASKVKERIKKLEEAAKSADKMRKNPMIKNKDKVNKIYGSRKKALESAKQSLKQIRVRQAKAIGGTALGVGALGGAGYLATKKDK